MLNSSFTVAFRNVTEFISLVARIPGVPKQDVVFAWPSVIYGRKDGQHTVRVKAREGYVTRTLGQGYTEFIGVRADGTSVRLAGAPYSTTREAIVQFGLSDPETLRHMQEGHRIYAIKRLRQAYADAGLALGLKEAKDATDDDRLFTLMDGRTWAQVYGGRF